MTTILKLGGSVLTEKDRPETVDESNLRRAATAVARAATVAEPAPEENDLVVVHGGGSFGHHHAAEHGVTTTDGTRDPGAVRAIHDAMKRLNGAVVAALADAGCPALPVHPLSAAHRHGEGELTLPVAVVQSMLGEGFVPVLHGDVVVHEDLGATILSGDEIVVALGSALDADRVGVCSAVPGVLDDGDVVTRVESLGDVEAVLGGSAATDVTGGMAAKVRELLALNAPAYIFDLEGLPAFLDGEEPGTRIG